MTGNTPTLIDPQLVRDVDVVVTLGRKDRVDPVPDTRFENWDTDEPSEGGIEPSEGGIDGIERMRLAATRPPPASPISSTECRPDVLTHFSK